MCLRALASATFGIKSTHSLDRRWAAGPLLLPPDSTVASSPTKFRAPCWTQTQATIRAEKWTSEETVCADDFVVHKDVSGMKWRPSPPILEQWRGSRLHPMELITLASIGK